MQIKRKKLVKIAFKLIKEYEDEILVNNRKHLFYAACTADKIALGGWVLNPTCGCLVGTAYLNELPPADREEWTHADGDDLTAALANYDSSEASALYRLGIKFDERLREAINADSKEGEVAVID